jgi:lipopolysaccharide transport system permease protein
MTSPTTLSHDTDLQVPSPEPTARSTHAAAITVIERRPGWRVIDWREIWQYRDLFYFLVFRGIKARYAQSVLGVGWAVIQPFFAMVVFTIVFGNLANVDSDGAPYALFSFSALVPWTYFANAVTEGTQSLTQNSNMIRKVYFPRLLVPLAASASKLVDFAIAMVILLGLLLWYGRLPNIGIVTLPLLIALMVLSAAGLGLWLSALAIQYRDVNHGVGFLMQLLMYAAPVVYPTSLIPERYQMYYSLNPMVGVIEGFRSAILGTRDIPWSFLGVGAVTANLIFISGLYYFRRRERVFADVA